MLSFLNALPGAVSQGLIWGIMAIGVYITYKILDIADLTVDGSFCTGGAVFVMLFSGGVSVWAALLAALLAGMLAGLITGLLNTLCGIPAILSGILTQLGLSPIWVWACSRRASSPCCTASSARSWAALSGPRAPTPAAPGPRALTPTSARCWA